MTEVPLYEYQCPNDGVFELMRKFSDPPLLACPTCGAPVEKLLSAPAIQFKGTGWYVTDYARKGGTDKGGKDKGSTETKSGEASSFKETTSSSSSGTSSTPSPSGTASASTNAGASGSDKK